MKNDIVVGRGGIEVVVIEDSVSPSGDRLSTLQLKYHRFIHGEVMTHRLFSRNASSSRAIPTKKLIEQVANSPATPIHWGMNRSGMQATQQIDTNTIEHAKLEWKGASLDAAHYAKKLNELGVHKQVVNRVLEPFQFMHTIVTATEWENFFNLRIHKDAQPEIFELARCIKEAMDKSIPKKLSHQEYHLPYVEEEDRAICLKDLIKVSAARCARVSYLTHNKAIPKVEEDIKLYDMLATRPYNDGEGHVLGEDDPVHLSPLEHQATPMEEGCGISAGTTHIDKNGDNWSGNFKGWIQYRQTI